MRQPAERGAGESHAVSVASRERVAHQVKTLKVLLLPEAVAVGIGPLAACGEEPPCRLRGQVLVRVPARQQSTGQRVVHILE